MLLFDRRRRFDRRAGDCQGPIWLWLALAATGFGGVLAGAWALASNAFPWWHKSSMPLMPAAAVMAVMGLGPFREALAAPAALLERDDSARSSVVSAVLIGVFMLCLLDLLPSSWEGAWLPAWLGWLRPQEEYRVLILMPAWGAWAMMVPTHFVPTSTPAPPLVTTFCRNQPVGGTAICLAGVLAGSLWQLSFLAYGWAALPAGAAATVGSFGAVAVCRFNGGVSRQALLASNVATQLAFLLGYLSAKTHLIT